MLSEAVESESLFGMRLGDADMNKLVLRRCVHVEVHRATVVFRPVQQMRTKDALLRRDLGKVLLVAVGGQTPAWMSGV